MGREMLISIIVPVYNVGKYVDRCINSIVSQTYRDLEVIIVNDGSEDESHKVCKKWSEIDHRIKYIYQENKGVSVARNNGIMVASGEYIAFVDGDDYLDKTFLGDMVQFAEKYPDFDIIMCGYKFEERGCLSEFGFFSGTTFFDTKDRNRLICRSIGIYEEMVKRKTHLGVPWAKLYKTSFLRDNCITFDAQMPRMQDLIFNIRCFRCFSKAIYFDKPLYIYVKRGDSTANGYKEKYEDDARQIIEKLTVATNGINDPYVYEAVNYKTVLLLIECIRLQFAKKECPLSWKEKKKGIERICSEDSFRNAISYRYKYIKNSLVRNAFLFALSKKLYFVAYIMVVMKYRRD